MKKKLIIPTKLSEITLGQYQRYMAIEEPTQEDMLCIFLEISRENLNAISSKDIPMIANSLSELFESETPFINRFKFADKEYAFIPNLDEITYGENKDITSYLGDWSTMHLAMAVMFREIKQTLGSKYLIKDYNGVSNEDVYKAMPLDVVLGAMVFFYNLTNALLKAIPNYLSKKMTKEQMDELIHLPQLTSMLNGLRSMKSTHWLKETSLK